MKSDRREGIFYEVGARSAVLAYLFADDWKEEAQRRVAAFDHTVEEGQHLMESFAFVPASLLDEYDTWCKGVFIDPHPGSLEEILRGDLVNDSRAVLVQGAVSTHETFAEVVEPLEGTHTAIHYEKAVVLPDTNIMEDWEMGKRFWTGTFGLDALFAQFGVPDYLRLNAEGAEGQILAACSWAAKPRYIQVTDYFYPLCESVLAEQGYQIVPSLDVTESAWWISLRSEEAS